MEFENVILSTEKTDPSFVCLLLKWFCQKFCIRTHCREIIVIQVMKLRVTGGNANLEASQL
jgi:hypothetical protein